MRFGAADAAIGDQVVNNLLSSPVQTKPAQASHLIPTNQQVEVPSDMQRNFGNVDTLIGRMNVVDWDAINRNRAQWDTRWNHQIER